MPINEIFEHVPSIIGNFISEIFCISKEEDVAYKLEYTGSTLKVQEKENYAYFATYLNKYNYPLEDIEKNDTLKKVIGKETIIYMEKIDAYKVVIICQIETSKVTGAEKPTLLIADDSPVITKFFKKNLENEYNILVASNGEEAINLIKENLNKNLIGAFIDLQMPVKSGYDVLEYLKENDLFTVLPTSVISGEDSQDGIEKATNYGIIDMLQKPFNAESAKSIVDKTIQHSKNN